MVVRALNPIPKRRPRGEARRVALAKAALRLIARDGIASVTHRTVAREAGVSLSATTYYFNSKEDLIAAANEQYIEGLFATIEQLVFEDAATGSRLAKMTPEAVADTLARYVARRRADPQTRTLGHELAIESLRNPLLRKPHERWLRATTNLYRAVALRFDSDTPEVDATILSAIVWGTELFCILRPGTDLEALFRRITSALFVQSAHRERRARGRRRRGTTRSKARGGNAPRR